MSESLATTNGCKIVAVFCRYMNFLLSRHYGHNYQ